MPYIYILKCADESFYTGSTVNLEKRLWEHNNGLGANHTKNRLPVELVFCEEFAQIDEAFYREKQVQGWSRAKKLALIAGRYKDLPALALSSSAKALASTGSNITSASTGSANVMLEPVVVAEPVEAKEPSF